MRARPRLGLLCLLLIGLSSAAAGGAPAGISLVEETRADGSWHLVAAVKDGAGAPVEGATVTFLGRTAFGWLRLAEVDTGATGTASFALPAVPPYREVQARAGDGETLQAGLLARPPAHDPVRRPGLDVLREMSPQPGFISPYPPVQILFVVALLGGIWMTYAYLVSLLIRMKRAH